MPPLFSISKRHVCCMPCQGGVHPERSEGSPYRCHYVRYDKHLMLRAGDAEFYKFIGFFKKIG